MPQINPISPPLVIKDLSAPKLNAGDFERLIIDYGYDVTLERAIRCPCTNANQGYAVTSCINCGGSSWFFTPVVDTTLVLQSMGANKKYENWTEENLGTVNITARYVDRVSFMDRITLIDSVTEFSQLLNVFRGSRGKYQAYTIYNPIEILFCYQFVGEDKVLKQMVLNTDYTISNNLITFVLLKNMKDERPFQISVRYSHHPQYHVIDIQRDIVTQKRKKQCTGEAVTENFPVRATAKIAHNVLDAQTRLS